MKTGGKNKGDKDIGKLSRVYESRRAVAETGQELPLKKMYVDSAMRSSDQEKNYELEAQS